MHVNNLTRTTSILLLLLAVHLGMAACTGLTAPPPVTAWLYSEAGPCEVFSVWLWLLLAGAVLLCAALQRPTRAAAAAAAMLMSARELDMHKLLFGESFIRTNFYRSADTPLSEKLLGGSLLLALLALLIYLSVSLFRHLQRRQLSDSSLLLLSGLALGAGSKVLDRLSSQLHELLQIDLSPLAQQMIVIMEESLELTMPLLLLTALLTYRRTTR